MSSFRRRALVAVLAVIAVGVLAGCDTNLLAPAPLQFRVSTVGPEVRLCSERVVEELDLKVRSSLSDDWVDTWSAEGLIPSSNEIVFSEDSLPFLFDQVEMEPLVSIPEGAQVSATVVTSTGVLLGVFDLDSRSIEGDWINSQNVDPSLTCEELSLL